MPSTSAKQHRFMEAVDHDPTFAKKVGVPQSVGHDFVQADKAQSFANGGVVMNKGYMGKTESYAAGGAVLGRSKDFAKTEDRSKQTRFMKVPDEFRNPDEGNAAADEDQNYAKSGPGAGKGFIKPPPPADKSC